MTDAAIRVLLVDDHTLFRRGLKALLAGDARFAVVDFALTKAENKLAKLEPWCVMHGGLCVCVFVFFGSVDWEGPSIHQIHLPQSLTLGGVPIMLVKVGGGKQTYRGNIGCSTKKNIFGTLPQAENF